MPLPSLRRNPAVVALLLLAGAFWLWNPVVFITDDAYIYPVVARNLATRGVQSFWGVEPTNGVSPLWLYLLGAYSWAVARLSADWLYRPGFGVPLVLVVTLVGAVNWIAVAERARLSKVVVLCVPLLFLSAFGLLYSEAHAAFLVHSILVRAVSGEESDGRTRPWMVGLAAAGVCLARLDNAFYIAAFTLWYWARSRSPQMLVRMAAGCLLPVAIYLIANRLFFGSVITISGYLTSSFPVPQWHGLGTPLAQPAVLWSGYSVAFGWAPIGLGLVVALALGRRISGLHTLLYPLLAGTVAQALYSGLFTVDPAFAYRDYLLPIMLLSWALACLTTRLTRSTLDQAVQWAAVLLLAAALGRTRLAPPTEERQQGLKTLRVIRTLGIDRATILVSDWPGTLAFFTRNDVIAADMLTSNRRLVDRLLSGGNAGSTLLEAAKRRGSPVDYVVFNGGLFLMPNLDLQSLTYLDPRTPDPTSSHPIGHLFVGPALQFDEGLWVWRVPPTGRLATSR